MSVVSKRRAMTTKFLAWMGALLALPILVAVMPADAGGSWTSWLEAARRLLPEAMVTMNDRFAGLSRSPAAAALSQVALWLVMPVMLAVGAIHSPCAETLRIRPGPNALKTSLINASITSVYFAVALAIVFVNVIYPAKGAWILAGARAESPFANTIFGGLSLAVAAIVLRAAVDHAMAFKSLFRSTK